MSLVSDLIAELENVAPGVVSDNLVASQDQDHPTFGSSVLVNIRLDSGDLSTEEGTVIRMQVPTSLYFVKKSWYEEHGCTKLKSIFFNSLVCAIQGELAFHSLGLTQEAQDMMSSMHQLYYLVLPIKLAKLARPLSSSKIVPIGMKNLLNYEGLASFLVVRDIIVCGRAIIQSSRSANPVYLIHTSSPSYTWKDLNTLLTAINNSCALFGMEQLPELPLEVPSAN